MIDIRNLPSIPFSQRATLPKTSGVYIVLSDDQVVYVGSSSNIKTRLGATHHRLTQFRALSNVEIRYFEMELTQALQLETLLISQLQPALNNTPVDQSQRFFRLRKNPYRETLMQQVAERMRQEGIPYQHITGDRNDTLVIEYALRQAAKKRQARREEHGKANNEA